MAGPDTRRSRATDILLEMGSRSSVSICAVQVEARLFQLWVECCAEDDGWTWKIRTRQGDTLEEGLSESKVAAQVAAQLAFERPLNLAGLSRTASAKHNRYHWSECFPR